MDLEPEPLREILDAVEAVARIIGMRAIRGASNGIQYTSPAVAITVGIISLLQQILQLLKVDKLAEFLDFKAKLDVTLSELEQAIKEIEIALGESEMLELQKLLKSVGVKLEEDRLTKLDEHLYVRKTADGVCIPCLTFVLFHLRRAYKRRRW